jgi:hypothetical protein
MRAIRAPVFPCKIMVWNMTTGSNAHVSAKVYLNLRWMSADRQGSRGGKCGCGSRREGDSTSAGTGYA